MNRKPEKEGKSLLPPELPRLLPAASCQVFEFVLVAGLKSYKTKDYLGRISRGNCSFLKLLNHFFKLLIYNVMLISDVKQSESDFFGLVTRHVGY